MRSVSINLVAPFTGSATRQIRLLLLLSAALVGFFLLLEFVVSLASTGPRDILAVSPSQEKRFGVPNGVDLLRFLAFAVSIVLASAVLLASLGWPLRRLSLRPTWTLAVGLLVAAALVAAGAYLAFSGVLGSAVSYDEHEVQRSYLESGGLLLLGTFFLSLTIAGILNWRLLVASLVVWLAAAGVFGFLDTEPIDGLLLFPRTNFLEVPANFAEAVSGFRQTDGTSSGRTGGEAGAATGTLADTSLQAEVTALQLLPPADAPVFQVTGAAHTRYLRTSTGDTYTAGTWSGLDAVGVTVGRDVPVLDALAPLAGDLHLPTATPLHEFTDRIIVTPVEGDDRLPAGALPVSKNLRSVNNPATYYPASETLVADSGVSGYQWESTLPLFALLHKVGTAPVTDPVYLQLPDELPPRVHELARQVGTAGSPYLRARQLQVFLQEGYTFGAATTGEEALPPPGRDPVDWFLFDRRVGTSGNFSSAFVVLARAAGIPARAVSGWVVATQEDTQTVHRSQTHQWAEIALDWLGWVTVDPIPRDAFADVDVDHGFEAALEEMGTSADPAVREAVAGLWSDANDPEALLLLFQAVDNALDTDARDAARTALSTLAFDRFTGVLLEHEDPLMRAAAAYGLGVLADPRAVEPLVQALAADEDARVRVAAADTLAIIGKDAAEEPLLRALDTDPDAAVREAAAQALGSLQTGWTAARMLPALGSDPAPEVRAGVALALGAIRENVALPPLLDAHSGDVSDDVRAAAAAALMEWDFDALLEVLENAEDPAWRAAAARLMGERGYPDAIAPLGAALGDPAEEVREAARAALEEIGDVAWLEGGGGVLEYESDIAFVPSVTAESIPRIPRAPVFRVDGALNTSLLRVAVGDTYVDGTWIPTEQDDLAGGIGGVGFRSGDIRPRGDIGTRNSDSIYLSGIGPAQLILSGHLPTSLHAAAFSRPVTYRVESHTVIAGGPPVRYEWDAHAYDYSPTQLNAARTWTASGVSTYTQLPDGPWVERVRELAARITAGHATPYARAKAIEQYLLEGYMYRFASGPAASTPPGQDPIETFLFDSRAGTCGNFSSAFVMLARSVGIPARVVSGWAIAERPDSQTVYTDQAHQWAEVPFDGLGWVSFDPTPGGAPSRAPHLVPRPGVGESDGTGGPGSDAGTDGSGSGTGSGGSEDGAGAGFGDGDGTGGLLSAEDLAALARADEATRDAALEVLEDQGTDVTRLENGQALLTLEEDFDYWVGGTTTHQAPHPPSVPVFTVKGAAHTGYLRMASGDIYENGGWRQLDPVGVPFTAGEDVSAEVREQYDARAGDFSAVPAESLASQALFGFRDSPLRVVSDRIWMFPSGSTRALPNGVMPTSPDLQQIDLDGVFYPFSATLVSEERVSSYSWESRIPLFSEGQYLAAGTAASDPTYTQLPPDLPARIGELARQVTAPHDSPYAKARALEQYLKTQYPYSFAGSLSAGVPPAGRDPVDWFLFDSRTGTCGQYSSAFVVMARSVGIPARVVSGWAISPTAKTQIVYTDQGHQWAEVALDGIGWVSFEPTASGPPSRVREILDDPIDTVTNITLWPTEIRRGMPFVVGGTVQTTDGQGVGGMIVEVYINETKEHGGTHIGTTTSRSGRFQAEVQLAPDMELGGYQLLARAVANERFNESWSDPDIKVFSGNRIELAGPAEVVLNARATFTGRVMEDNGQGSPGRALSVTIDGNTAPAVTTDPAGRFTFSDSFSRLGQHWVEVQLRGEEFLLDNSARLDFQVVLPTEVAVYAPAAVVIGEEFEVGGELRGVDGGALAGKRIGVRVGRGSEQSVTTDGEGRFEVMGTVPSAGEFTITARFRGEGSVLASGGTTRFQSLHAVTMTLEGPLRLERGDGAVFQGRLASDTFSPTGQVELTVGNGSDGQAVTVDVAEGGTFEYRHPSFGSIGPHALTARFAGAELVQPASAEFAFEVLEPTVLTLDGPAIVRDGDGFRLTGILRESNGSPVPGAGVQVVGDGPLSLTTDAEGAFTWDAQAIFDQSAAHDPHESTQGVDVVFEGTDLLAPSSATLDIPVGLPRIVVEALEPVARGREAVLRGTVLLGTYPVPGAGLTAGPGVTFESSGVGTFTHPYPVSGDEPLGATEVVLSAPELGAGVTVPLVVKSAANLIVTPVGGCVRAG